MDEHNKTAREFRGKDGESFTVTLGVSISVVWPHPLFAHHTQRLRVALVLVSELITG